MPILDTLRIIGSGGANRAMEAEIKRLAGRAIPGWRPPKPIRVDTQTLLYPYDEAFAWFAVNYLRTPSRVVWDLLEIESERLEPLYEEVKKWIEDVRPPWLGQGLTISVKVPDACDFPASGLQIRGTIKNAIIDGAKKHQLEVALDPDAPQVQLLVRGAKKPLTLSIDLAGHAMHARGYRLEEGEAPLKENVAAQMLMLARWDLRSEVLIDPLAGGGTLAIEGALMATASPLWIPPRRPAADTVPGFVARAENAKTKGLPGLFADAQPRIIANEIHTPSLEQLKRNVERADAGDRILATHGDFRDLTRARLGRELQKRKPRGWPDGLEPFRGLVIANPPYGERLKEARGREGDLIKLYTDLRDWIFELGEGWRAAFIIAHPEFEEIFGGRPVLKKPIWNGSIRAWALVYEPNG